MRRSIGVVLLLLAFLLLLSSPASAQPTQGMNSTNFGTTGGRNENGYGGPGVPHCHVLTTGSGQVVRTFPSHTGHDASGLSHVFAADSNCNGIANPG